MEGDEGWVPPSSSSSVQLLMACAPLGPFYCLHWKLKIPVLAHCMRHRDHTSAFRYCNWENLLVCRLSHPGGGPHHHLNQLLCLMQVKPLSRLLIMTERQEGRAQAEDDTILNIWGIHHYHIFYDSNCPQGSQGWLP